MSQERKRPGPKPSGRPHKRPMSFTVSEEHRAWLDTLPNRSAWLAEQVEKAREKSRNVPDSVPAGDDAQPD